MNFNNLKLITIEIENQFNNIKCLDLSCGEGRNIILLDKLGFDYYATEVNQSICEKISKNIVKINPSVNSKWGNSALIILFCIILTRNQIWKKY